MSRSLGGTDADKIDLGTSATLNPNGATASMTFACWAYATSFPNTYNAIFKRIDAGGTHYYALQPKSTGKMAIFWVNSAGGAFAADGNGTFVMSTGTWVHLAMTLGGGAQNKLGSVWVNGVTDTSTNDNTGSGIASITGDTGLGFDPTTVNAGWAGRLAEAGLWNVALTSQELLALANGTLPWTIRSVALIGYWPIYGLASPEPDFSGNKNNGTLTGTALAAGAPVMPFTTRWPRFLGWTPMLPASGLGWIINRRNKLMVPKKRA